MENASYISDEIKVLIRYAEFDLFSIKRKPYRQLSGMLGAIMMDITP